MTRYKKLFATPLYHAPLKKYGAIDLREIKKSCLSIADDDQAGQIWCLDNGYLGYTSYASLADLGWRFPIFSELEHLLNKHVEKFVEDLDWDLGDKKVLLENLWINILPEGGAHASHIHTQSVVSGTAYISMPKGASSIRFEDPRLTQMMAAPPRHPKAREHLQTFISLAPKAGDVLLWESWLRHDVPMNMAAKDRITVSFNYRWGT